MGENERGDEYLFKALWLAGNDRADEAVEVLRDRIKVFPTERHPRRQLAVTLGRQGRPREALEECRQLLDLCPDWWPARSLHGELLHANGRLSEAADEFLQILSTDQPSENSLLHRNTKLGLARVYRDQKRYSEAMLLLMDIVDGAQPLADAFLILGELFAKLGRIKESTAVLQRLVEWNPRHREGFLRFGNALERDGRFAEAAMAWRRVLEIQIGPPEQKLHESLQRIIDEARASLSRIGT